MSYYGYFMMLPPALAKSWELH